MVHVPLMLFQNGVNFFGALAGKKLDDSSRLDVVEIVGFA